MKKAGTATAKWHTVKATDYYGAFESIGDNKLKTRMDVLVRWPDKSITEERLIVVDANGSAQIDMNNCPNHFKTRALFVRTMVRGLAVLVPLNGLRVAIAARKRERKEAA